MRKQFLLLGMFAFLLGCERNNAEESASTRAEAAEAAADGSERLTTAGPGAAVAALAAVPPSQQGCKAIQFQRGTSSATVSGVVPGGNRNDDDPAHACYTLAVGDGQRAQVRIVSGENVQINIPGVDDGQDSIDFTTRRGTYRILVFQLFPHPSPHPFRMQVAVSALASRSTGGSGAAGSCTAEIGAQAAGRLAEQCKMVSPATRPPCHPDNSCALIRDEIERGCGQYPGTRPRFCTSGGAGTSAGTGGTPAGSAWLVGTWAPVQTGCRGDDKTTYRANGTYEQDFVADNEFGHASGRWKLKGSRISWTITGGSGDDGLGPISVDVGQTISSSVTRNAANEMVTQEASGRRTRYVRCP